MDEASQDKPTPGRAEIVIKFDRRPKPLPVAKDNKRVELRFKANTLTFIVRIKNKGFNKFNKSADQYEHWKAAVQGKLGTPVSKNTFMLDDAAIQVFEVKPKEPKEEATAASAPPPASTSTPQPVARPEPAPPAQEAAPPPRPSAPKPEQQPAPAQRKPSARPRQPAVSVYRSPELDR